MSKPIISFQNYSFQYQSQSEPTLKEINLEISRGERVIIIGASGCGKSTLAHGLNGLIPFCYKGKQEGSLQIDGKETSAQSIFELSKHVGTVLQDTDGQFIGMTVLEDIAFALENDLVEPDEMLRMTMEEAVKVNLVDKLDQAPHDLSGGQKQRVSLAGVLISQSPILLFDEPLANLDPSAGKEAIALIDKIQSETDTTVIIIEHRLEDALYMGADRIILMEEGRIIADTTPTEIFLSDKLLKAGIREPLYITAMKYANVSFRKGQNLGRIQDLTLEKEQIDMISQWFHSKKKEESIEMGETILKVEDISFGYVEEQYNLSKVSFEIKKGEMVSIVGRNGAGKSTLAKLLCGFEKLNTGNVFLHGRNVNEDTIKEHAKYIGYVMQNPNQMISKPMLFEEVEMALRLKQAEVVRESGKEALTGLKLTDEQIKERVLNCLKKCGLYEFRNWPISALSYGQKKRVTIASILVNEPEILILDEPTAGQDFRHYTEFMEFLKELNSQGITVIMITHDMHLMLEYTHRCLVFTEGRLIADTTPSKLFANKEQVEEASLKETSLYDLALLCGIDPEEFIDIFIQYDRKVRK